MALFAFPYSICVQFAISLDFEFSLLLLLFRALLARFPLPFFCPLEGKDPSRLDLLQTGDTNMNKRKTDEDATQGRREGEEEERKRERERQGGEGRHRNCKRDPEDCALLG